MTVGTSRWGITLQMKKKEIVFEEFGAHDADGKVVFLSCTSTNPDRRKIIF